MQTENRTNQSANAHANKAIDNLEPGYPQT